MLLENEATSGSHAYKFFAVCFSPRPIVEQSSLHFKKYPTVFFFDWFITPVTISFFQPAFTLQLPPP
jgi:hypothetical protein